jgi:hypothetical protein
MDMTISYQILAPSVKKVIAIESAFSPGDRYETVPTRQSSVSIRSYIVFYLLDRISTFMPSRSLPSFNGMTFCPNMAPPVCFR